MPEMTFDTRITLTDAGRAAVYSPALPAEPEAICADCAAACSDCVCSLYPSRAELDAMAAKSCEEWEAQYGRNISDAEAEAAEDARNFFDLRFEN